MDAAPVAGTPTEERLADLLTEEAQRQLVASFRGELRQRAERMFTHAFHAALADGAADEILTSLRASFDTAAEAVATARDLIPTEAPAEQFLADAKPAAIAAWQQLDGHIATLEQIGRRIAATFGPRNGHFPLIEEYALGDGFRLHDAAICCTDGPNLESDSRAFRQPDRGHRTSPWFRTIPVKLHTVDSARDRYRQWASGEWQRLNAGPPTSYLDENGRMHQLPRPENPFATPELAKG